MDARAYAFGEHIVFGANEYAPSTGSGRELLGHELAHTIQQGDRSRQGATMSQARLEAAAQSAGRAAAVNENVSAPLGASPLTLARQPPIDPTARFFSQAEVQQLVGPLESTATPVGIGLRGFEGVSFDIDEPLAVSVGGAWDDPANKRFLESTTNRLTKNALTEIAPQPAPQQQISLAAAEAEGEEAFRAAARAMFDRNFSDVAELEDLTIQARARMRNLNRPDGVLKDAINKAIRDDIRLGRTPAGRLVARAMRVLGIDPQELGVRPVLPQSRPTGLAGPPPEATPAPKAAPVEEPALPATPEPEPGIPGLSTIRSVAPPIIMLGWQLAVGPQHQRAKQERIESQAHEEGYVGHGKGRSRLEAIGDLLLDPLGFGEESVPGSKRIDIPVWRNKVREWFAGHKPGDEFTFTWEVTLPGWHGELYALADGSTEYGGTHDEKVTYTLGPDGRWTTDDKAVKRYDLPDINWVMDPWVSDDDVRDKIMPPPIPDLIPDEEGNLPPA